MIFLTVGSQTPFDRLARAVDAWAAAHLSVPVFAQIGRTYFRPRHIRWVTVLAPAEFDDHCSKAERIVGHAGIGTILTAMQHRKPLIVMPRLASLGETRSEHQLATITRFARYGLSIAEDGDTLAALLSAPALFPMQPLPASAQPALLDRLRRFARLSQRRIPAEVPPAPGPT